MRARASNIKKECNRSRAASEEDPSHRVALAALSLQAQQEFSIRAMDEARAVFTTIVASLKGCGDKYGDALHDWLSNVVDGQRPKPLPRLDKRRLSRSVSKRRQLACDAAEAFKTLLHVRWLAGRGKRKVERQAERRKSCRQLEEPMSADCFYDGLIASDDDDNDDARPSHSYEPVDESCSDYELEKLRTLHGTTCGRMRACNDNDNNNRQRARMYYLQNINYHTLQGIGF